MSRKRNNNNKHGDPIEMMEACIKVFKELPETYDEAYEIVGITDSECQDLLHEIELLTLSRKDASEVLAAMRDNRAIRRTAKDFMHVSKPLRDYIVRNKHIVNDLMEIKRQMEHLKRNLRGRVYVPRVRHEKTDKFIAITAAETGKDPETIRAELQKSGVYPVYDEAAITSE